MTDDEILAIANEVLIPAGLSGAVLRKAPRPEWRPDLDPRSIQLPPPVPRPDSPHYQFYCGLGGKPVTPDGVRERVKGLVSFVVETTATWPTPWVPANRAEG
jgi:hypothetical protein